MLIHAWVSAGLSSFVTVCSMVVSLFTTALVAVIAGIAGCMTVFKGLSILSKSPIWFKHYIFNIIFTLWSNFCSFPRFEKVMFSWFWCLQTSPRSYCRVFWEKGWFHCKGEMEFMKIRMVWAQSKQEDLYFKFLLFN